MHVYIMLANPNQFNIVPYKLYTQHSTLNYIQFEYNINFYRIYFQWTIFWLLVFKRHKACKLLSPSIIYTPG